MDFSGTSSSNYELEQLIAKEQQKAQANEVIMNATSRCWDKCVGSIGSKFSSSEKDCLSNCAQRYMDLSAALINQFTSR